MNRAIQRLGQTLNVRREERVAAGRAGGAAWVLGSLSIIALSLVLPANEVNRPALLALGAAGALWGAGSALLLDDARLPVWLIHLSAVLGTASITAAIALSGGARSPAWVCLFYVVAFAAFFFRPTVASVYFLACVLIETVFYVVAPPGARIPSAARMVVVGPAFIGLGSAIVAGKWALYELRRQAERLAAEQSALRRVATAVVSVEPAEQFYRCVAVEAGGLMSADGAAVLRLGRRGEATVLGSWTNEAGSSHPVGAQVPVGDDHAVLQALRVGAPVRIQNGDAGTTIGALGYETGIVAPIKVAGRLWGFLAIVSRTPGAMAAEHPRRLGAFAELIAAAITNIEDRAALAAQAATDALTGVGNHRTFYQRLNADLARARRYGTPVSVAVIDVDHFKQVNDTHGHEAGDEMLVRVAGCLTAAGRAEDTIARVGGDEFAWILPETTGEEALAAVQRARVAFLAGSDEQRRVTITGGVCDTRWTLDPAELVRLADRALYVGKEHGRDQIRMYSDQGAEQPA
jgi:diguanylate cyclase (GGDEF)-like protein